MNSQIYVHPMDNALMVLRMERFGADATTDSEVITVNESAVCGVKMTRNACLTRLGIRRVSAKTVSTMPTSTPMRSVHMDLEDRTATLVRRTHAFQIRATTENAIPSTLDINVFVTTDSVAPTVIKEPIIARITTARMALIV